MVDVENTPEEKGRCPMGDILARGWANLIGRLDGPMHIRLIIQPLVAAFLALRAGVRDARSHEAPFLAAILRDPEHRRARLRQALDDIGKVFLVAVTLDAIYQLRVHRAIYLVELLLTASLLALVPYALLCGPATRVARALLAARYRSRRS
jgi:hypothetical protein